MVPLVSLVAFLVGSEAGQTVKSIGEALKAVLDIYKNQGQASNEQADFMSGFAPEGAKPQ